MQKNPLGPIDLIKKVGKGKSLSRPMSYEEAGLALRWILEGKFSPAQLGAFLQALRINELTQDELNGMADSLYSHLQWPAPPKSKGLVINLCQDTPRKRATLSSLAGSVLPYLGIDVALVLSTPVLAGPNPHSAQLLQLKTQLENLLREKWGSPKGSQLIVTANDLLPGWERLDSLRGELGFRSCLHTLEKVLTPWPTLPLFLGISHKHYALRLRQTLIHRKIPLGCVVLGNHGSVDLNLHKSTEAYLTTRTEDPQRIPGPADCGWEIPGSLYAGSALEAWKAQLTEKNSPLRQALIYQSGFLLWVAGMAPSQGDAQNQVRQLLEG